MDILVNPALERAPCRMLVSASANGPGVPCITIFIRKLNKGTFDASAQTAHTNLPHDIRACHMWLKVVLRFGININPHLQVADK